MRNFEKALGSRFPAERPLFYYITDRKSLPGQNLLCSIQRTVEWGVDFVQIREKDLPDLDVFDLTRQAVELVRGSSCKILVNSRADIALAAGAHGVHLPSVGLRPPDLASWLPGDFIIGVSAHSGREMYRAVREHADYVLLGPVFPTPSKLAYGPPIGLRVLRCTPTGSNLPVFGLGGIGPDQIRQVIEAGASGVAAISLFQNQLHLLGEDATALRHTLSAGYSRKTP